MVLIAPIQIFTFSPFITSRGRVGQEVIKNLLLKKVPFVLIEKKAEVVQKLQDKGILFIVGDATEDKTLLKASILKAKSLIACLPNDAANVFITLTSKGLNPDLLVIARSNLPESSNKLKRAGADQVISPSILGGRRMVNYLLKPSMVSFVDTLVDNQGVEFTIEEIEIPEKSPLRGLSL